MQTYLRISLFIFLGCVSFARAQSLNMVSGNGQVVQSQFRSNAPLVVQANDASGHPAPGVAVSWKITQGAGTLESVVTSTDSKGQASAFFLGTNVPGNESFFASTVAATASSGTVNFVITTTPTRNSNGGTAAPPAVQLLSPPGNNLSLTGSSGSTLAGAVSVLVTAQAGPNSGQAVPNVGIRIVDNQNPAATPEAACNGPEGVVLTGSNGRAICDLVITASPGTYQIAGLVGEYQFTPPFKLTVTPGVTCNFSLSSGNQNFPASGGSGTVNVNTTAGCAWTAASNAPFITVTSGASGDGPGVVGFSVAANTGSARNGTMKIAGQTFTVNQSGGTPGTVAINSPPNLAPGNVGSTYSVQLSASGGTPPYTWTLSGSLPPGLALNASQGIISGTPSATGTYGFTLTVTDNIGASASQSFSITINSPSTSGFAITNASFPSGVVGQAYKQLITSSGGCVTPFQTSPAIRLSGGALPNGLSIQTNADLTHSITGTPSSSGTFNFTLTATDACGNTATASFSIAITGTSGPAQMNVNPSSVSFTIQAGASNIPADQTIAITSSTSAVFNYTASASTESGGNWLVIRNATSGNTPGNLTVGLVNFSSLAPGPYSGSITIHSQASNSPVLVNVSLTVLAAPNLTVNPQSFTATQIGTSGQTITRQLITVNSSAPITFAASASTQSGGPWLSVTPSQGSSPGAVTAIINAGGLAAGMYMGTIAITPAGGTAQMVTITLDVVAPAVIIAAPAPLLFSYQQAGVLPAGQTLSLSSTAEALNLTVGVATQSGADWLTVAPSTVTTPATINVSANPTGLAPGQYQGSVNVSASDASVSPLTVQVTLTVSKPAPEVGSITNAASFNPGPVAPGEFVTIFGTSLGPTTPVSLELNAAGTVSTNLGGTQVFFDNIAAPLIYSSAGQVSAIVPYEVARRVRTDVKVEYQGSVSTVAEVRVIESAPGVFVADSSGQGAILNQDGSANSIKNGAAPGSIVSIYATGEGQTTPTGADGVINGTKLPLPKPQLPVTVQINGEPAEVLYAGAAPGQVAGMMQVNARIPADVPKGTSLPVTITVGPATSQAGVTLAIRP